MEHRTLIEGESYEFYTWNRGKHQELENGNFLISSTVQGRAFEVAPDGTVTFDFHNIFSEEHGSLLITEARFLSPDYFYELPECKS